MLHLVYLIALAQASLQSSARLNTLSYLRRRFIACSRRQSVACCATQTEQLMSEAERFAQEVDAESVAPLAAEDIGPALELQQQLEHLRKQVGLETEVQAVHISPCSPLNLVFPQANELQGTIDSLYRETFSGVEVEVSSRASTARTAATEQSPRERFDDLTESRFALLGRQRVHVLKV